MDFSDEQLQTLHDAGINPDDVLGDALQIQKTFQNLRMITDGTNFMNVGSQMALYTEQTKELVPLVEKYVDPRAQKVIKDFMKNEMGLTEEFLEQPADLGKKVEEIKAEAAGNPVMESIIEESIVKHADHIIQLANDMKPAQERIEEKQAQFEGMEENILQQEGQDTVAKMEEGGDLAKLKELYQRAESMPRQTSLPRDEQIKAYQDFFNAYDKALGLAYKEGEKEIEANDKMSDDLREAIKDRIDNEVGIPPRVFSDAGAHYTTLQADKLKDLMQQAEAFDPPETATPEETKKMLEQKADVLKKAMEMKPAPPKDDDGTANVEAEGAKDALFTPDTQQIENEAGHSFDSIQRELDYANEQVQFLNDLENTPSYAPSVELESDKAPEETVTPDESTPLAAVMPSYSRQAQAQNTMKI